MPWGAAIAAVGSVAGGAIAAGASGDAAASQQQGAATATGVEQANLSQTRADLAPFKDTGTAASYTLADLLGLPVAGGPQGLASNPDVTKALGARPTFDTVYQPFNQAHIAKYGIPMNRSWTADADAVQAKANLDQQLTKLQQDWDAKAAKIGGTSTPNTGALLKPFSFDIAQDPGYQFRLDQGTKALEGSQVAKGMQLSSATLDELVRYGQDYAAGEYQAAFNRDQTTKSQIYNMLSGQASSGQNAAGMTANAGANTANAVSGNITGAANANAAGTVGSANALSSGLTGAGNSAMNYYMLKNIFNPDKPDVSPSRTAAAYGPNPTPLSSIMFGNSLS